MTPELERLIELYARLRDAPAEEHHVWREAFESACLPFASGAGRRVELVMTFVREAYFKKLAAENRRSGRPGQAG